MEGPLSSSIEELLELAGEIEDALAADILSLIEDLRHLRDTFAAVALAWTDHDWAAAMELAVTGRCPRLTQAGGRRLARTLRRLRHPSSLAVQAALSRRSDATNLFVALQQNLGMKFITVIGEAGRGKTHLAAELTAESGDRPSGIYVEAWPLESRGTIDDLPPRLQDPMLRSFERLLEAVESAGMRAGTRIPIVIDGLSDSEDPATWKGELEKLRVVLAHFQHVVVVVTLRPTVVEFALPENSPRVELQGFDPDSLPKEAIRKYFDHYRIDAASLTLPLKRFRDPLFLRIFCEATNPDRRAWVGPESVPASLVGAFIRFRASAVKRIANRPGRIRRDAQDILRCTQYLRSGVVEQGPPGDAVPRVEGTNRR